MEEEMNSVRICYCINGHEIRYRGLMRATCPKCNARIIIGDVDGQHKIPDSNSSIPNTPITAPISSPPSRPTELMPKRVPMEPSNPDHRKKQEATTEPESIELFPKRANNATKCVTLHPTENPSKHYYLDYFGDRIIIPDGGGWIGRSAIGNEQFSGNLLISREHVYIEPLENGFVKIGPDKSLNGTYVGEKSEKRKIESNHSEVIGANTLIWLYNIPLRLEWI